MTWIARGCSLNVCDGNLRIEPAQLQAQADGSLRITVAMSATAHQFRAGHRMRLLVASGAHPRFARNLGIEGSQTTATTLMAAQQTVYHDAGRPSAVVLPVIVLPARAIGAMHLGGGSRDGVAHALPRLCFHPQCIAPLCSDTHEACSIPYTTSSFWRDNE